MRRQLGALFAAAFFCFPLLARDITLTETVTTKSVSSAVLSPAGDTIAFTRVNPRTPYEDDDGNAATSLYLVNAEGEEVPYLTGKAPVSNIQFDADGKRVFFLSKLDDDKHTTLYAMPVNGGAPQQIFRHDSAISSYALSSDGRYLAFRARTKAADDKEKLKKKGFKAEVYEEEFQFTHVFLVDLNSDEKEAEQLTDDRQVLSVRFRPNNEQLLVRTAPTPLIDDNYMKSSYALIDYQGESVHTYTSEGKLGKAEFSPDGRYLAVIGSADYNDPSSGRLFVYDGQRSHERREVVPNYQGHVRDISWRTNDELVWLGHVGTETEVQAITMQFLESRQLVEQGTAIVVGLDAATGRGDIVLRAHTPAHPTELFRLSRGQLERLTDSNPWLADIDLPEQEVITYTARDGQDLEGIVVYPKDYQQGQTYPLIMVVHGGPEAHYSNGWLDRYSNPAKYAASKGYALFFPNYRGSTGRGVEFSKLGQNDYAGKEFDDLVDGKDYLVEQGLVDAERVGITGGSYGGFASAWGATAHTEHYAASVMSVGISNNLSKFGTTDIANEMHAVHARSYPWDKWEWYLERSPIFHAEKARTPILIMHGKEDTRVHPSQSMELYRYLKTHGKVPVRLVLYPGEGHGNRRAAAQLDFAMRLMRWMDTFLVEQASDKPAHELPHAEEL